jgi:hypothetical protein
LTFIPKNPVLFFDWNSELVNKGRDKGQRLEVTRTDFVPIFIHKYGLKKENKERVCLERKMGEWKEWRVTRESPIIRGKEGERGRERRLYTPTHIVVRHHLSSSTQHSTPPTTRACVNNSKVWVVLVMVVSPHFRLLPSSQTIPYAHCDWVWYSCTSSFFSFFSPSL